MFRDQLKEMQEESDYTMLYSIPESIIEEQNGDLERVPTEKEVRKWCSR